MTWYGHRHAHGHGAFGSGLTCCRQFSALRYLHDEMRVVHRDVKPANIVLLHTGTIQVRASVRPAAIGSARDHSRIGSIGFADSMCAADRLGSRIVLR